MCVVRVFVRVWIMSAPPLSSSIALPDRGAKVDRGTFQRTDMPRSVGLHTSSYTVHPEPSRVSNDGHIGVASRGSNGVGSHQRRRQRPERPAHGGQRPIFAFTTREVPPLALAAVGQWKDAPQLQEMANKVMTHPYNVQQAAAVPPSSPPFVVEDVPPSAPDPPSSCVGTACNASLDSHRHTGSSSSGSDNDSRKNSSHSITSSQYLCAIQQDLEALVQLQQQQLVDKMEVELTQQQQQQQQLPYTTVAAATPAEKSAVQLHSIDAVKQAFMQDAAAHRLLPPPPPMNSLAAPAPSPNGHYASSMAVHPNRSAMETGPQDISNTSLLPRPAAAAPHPAGANLSSDDTHRIAAAVAAPPPPPPPPSSSPIPASLVEYHAYLMQLEHQQRQHYEVLRRQRKQQRKKTESQQQQQHEVGRRGSQRRHHDSRSAASGETPPRQRISGAAAAAAATAVEAIGRAGEGGTSFNRRDRSPPLAQMLRTMRHYRRGGGVGGDGDDEHGMMNNHIYGYWNSVYAEDGNDDETDEEDEENGGFYTADRKRGGSSSNNAAAGDTGEKPGLPHRVVSRREHLTPGKPRRGTPQQASVEASTKPSRLRTISRDGGGGKHSRHDTSNSRRASPPVQGGASSSLVLRRPTPGHASLSASAKHRSRRGGAAPRPRANAKTHLRSPNAAAAAAAEEEAEERSTSRGHSRKAQRASFGSEFVQQQQQQPESRASVPRYAARHRVHSPHNHTADDGEEGRQQRRSSRPRRASPLQPGPTTRQHVYLGEDELSSLRRDKALVNSQPPHTPPQSYQADAKMEEEGKIIKAAADTLENNDDDGALANLPDVSPIKPTPSMLERELGKLSLLNPNPVCDPHPLAATHASSSATAPVNRNAISLTPSSSPVEAFADALLLDTSESPGGGGDAATVANDGSAPPPQQQQEPPSQPEAPLVTAAPLATITSASLAPDPRVLLPFAARSAGTTTTTTTIVGGTAAMQEPIAFSISPAGLVVPVSTDPCSSSSKTTTATNRTPLSQQQQSQPQLLWKNSVMQRARDQLCGVDHVAAASETAASMSKLPNGGAIGANATAVGEAAATLTAATAAATVATADVTLSSPSAVLLSKESNPNFIPEAMEHVHRQGERGQRRRSPAAAAAVSYGTENDCLEADGPSFASTPGLYALPGGQRERHRHHHHHHRRSFEGISSMIPEHGTGTPRSSRYRNNSTGTGGNGSRDPCRKQAGVRSGSVWRDEAEHELRHGARHCGADAGAATAALDGWKRAVEAHKHAEDDAEFMQLLQQSQSRIRRRCVPRHSNSGPHNMMLITTDEAPIHKAARSRELHRFKEVNSNGVAAGSAAAATRRGEGDTDVKHEICGAARPPWRSSRALIPAESRRTSAREFAVQRSPNRQAAVKNVPGVVEKSTAGDESTRLAEDTATTAATAVPPPQRTHAQPSPLHHSRLAPSASAAAVWHDVKRMWAPAAPPPGPFAAAYRYYPYAVAVSTADEPPTLLQLLLPARQPPSSPAHKDPQTLPSRQSTADVSAGAGAAPAEKKKSGRLLGEEQEGDHLNMPAAAAAATATEGPSTALASVPSRVAAPLSHAARANRLKPSRSRSPTAAACAGGIPAPLFCMTDSLIGAALRDVVPLCRARQREVAREVDRRRYQIAPVAPSFTV